jgi:uncharacterized protein involved in exopolysaccharide biosynthesis
MPLSGKSEHAAVDLRGYLRVIWKRRWACAAVLAVTAISAAVFTSLQTPIYHAAATVLIEPEAPRVVTMQDVAPLQGTEEYYPTQYRLIQSRPVIEAVIQRLRIKERFPWIAAAQDAYLAFRGPLRVAPVRNTRLVLVGYESPDPNFAAEVANAVAAEYVKYNLELKHKVAQDALIWLGEQLAGLRTQTQRSARALQTYQAQADLLGVQEQRQLAQQRIIDSNRMYLDAQEKRLTIEAKLREVTRIARDPAGAESIFLVADDPSIRKLKTEAADLQSERAKLRHQYREKHPDVLLIDAQIKQLNQRLQAEIQRLLRALETEHKVARAREESLLGNVNQLKDEARRLYEREAQAVVLQRDKDSTEELQVSVLKRLKETGIFTALEANNVRIVEPATPPPLPVWPRTGLIRILSVVSGLVLGIGLAFVAESLDNRVRSADDVERVVGLPVLGIVPVFQAKREG